MKRLLLILIFTLIFQTWTKADDIRDFEIEGMSIGDSLLDYMSESEIKDNDLNYYEKNSKFYTVGYTGTLKEYEAVEISIKRNDIEYEIYTIRAGFFMEDLSMCLKERDKIIKEIRNIFTNPIFQKGEQAHYKFPKSTQYISQFKFKDSNQEDDNIRVECMIWDNETKNNFGYSDNLSIFSQSGTILNWMSNR
jgi:hypothetical protein